MMLPTRFAFVVLIGGAWACGDEQVGLRDPNAGSEGTESDGGTDTDTGGPVAPAGPDHAPDPAELGPFPVGVRTLALTDPSRGDIEPRPLTTEVWYPATDAAIGGEGAIYTVEDLLRPDALALLTEPLDAEFVTTAVRDAEVRTGDGPYPVVMFSHGSGGVRMQSTYLTVALASHGYIVVAPDHYGNTLSDVLIDGGLDTAALLESLGERTIDLDFLVEYLAGLAPSEPLAEATDLSRMGVAGHSFGALTSIRWLGLGAPVGAVVAQAPPEYDLAWVGLTREIGEFDVPVMLHVGGLDDTTPPEDAESIWVETTPPRARLTLANAGHFTFSDLCQLDREAIEAATDLGVADALGDGCGEQNTAPDVAVVVLRHFAIGYFNVHLRNSTPTADLLTEAMGRMLAGDEVTYESEPAPQR